MCPVAEAAVTEAEAAVAAAAGRVFVCYATEQDNRRVDYKSIYSSYSSIDRGNRTGEKKQKQREEPNKRHERIPEILKRRGIARFENRSQLESRCCFVSSCLHYLCYHGIIVF